MTPKRMATRVWSLAWISVALFTAGSLRTVNADQTAFIGVDVIPMYGHSNASPNSPLILIDYNVIIEDGRITAMGPRASTPPPNATLINATLINATLIEAEGKYLIPGLADMHVHLMDQEFMTALVQKDDPIQPIENMLYLYLANGVTTVRVMAGYPELLALRDSIIRGEVLGPRLIVTTPMFDGKKPIWPAPLGRSIPSPEAARIAVRESKQDGYDMIKMYTLLAPDAYDAVLEEAKKVNLKVVGHVPLMVGLEHALESGQDEITHVEEYWRFTRDYGDAVVAQYTAMTAESGAWFSPTMTTYQDQLGDIEAIDTALNRLENRYLEPLILEFWAARANQLAGANDSQKVKARKAIQMEALGGFMRRLVKSMYDAGVPLMTGTDALNPMATPGFSLHRELELFAEVGIPNYETLRAATSGPAEFMGETDEWGTVAIGRRADLVLLSANPLEDIANTKKIEGVMVRGRWLTDETIQQQLDQFAEKYARSKN